ncbi:hypothetical protein [Microcella sp.]|uniref:hypothetical protein n=1 Tax=Microcella sp. TaxID=1913979 RepID=UPI00391D710A
MIIAADQPRTRALNRAAGTTALIAGGLAALVTVAHLAQTVWTIAQGRVGTASVEIVDGGVMVTSMLNPGDVSVEAVIAALVGDVTILIVIGVVSSIAVALVRDRPFGRRTPRAVAVAGFAVAIGGSISAVFSSVAARRDRTLLDQIAGVSAPDGPLDVSLGILTVSLLPIAAGLTIVFIAVVFARGTELQRATEGLV